MDTKLTRAELNDRLDDLKARAAIIAKSSPAGEQAQEVAGEAEVLEQYVATQDHRYFHDQVEAIIRDAGMVEPEAGNE
ncbi:hypothetical protein ABB27_14570 [Stenotrophomonas terrae]|uniref:Uncharacterized protein n=1 Tax=Stenotrophomonas terrae TaxID=405446 RepID=A0A0R0CHG0_9GAMM|nr:hypothetical protein [Stenotrophomonas terrae]KRG65794.1 hypothetical protein ABB27_14570 [Stenotrophomonas terrae]